MAATTVMEIPKVPFPKKAAPLFVPHPYKVLYGGRGSGKSWSVARALLIIGMKRPERILCTREVQHSIKDSVHQLLVDQIKEMGLYDFYTYTDTTIRGMNGTTFVFTGLQEHTIDSTRSLEGITIVWVEEAQAVRKASWKVLIPTIRTKGREFWLTFNPFFDTGETYKRFVIHPPKGAVLMEMNWRDNPWFPEELEQERQHAKATMEEEEYDNVWEGKPLRSLPGSIYAKQIAAVYRDERVTLVPYDPRLKVHVVQDLGFTNSTAVGFFQRRVSEVRCIEAFEVSGMGTPEVAAEIKKRPYNWGAVWLPHDGFASSRHGQNDAATYRSFGFVVRRVPDTSKENGIRALMEVLPACWFHEPKTKALLEHLKRYRRGESKDGVIGQPVHDENSDTADMMRYMSLCAMQFYNEMDEMVFPVVGRVRHDAHLGTLGV